MTYIPQLVIMNNGAARMTFPEHGPAVIEGDLEVHGYIHAKNGVAEPPTCNVRIFQPDVVAPKWSYDAASGGIGALGLALLFAIWKKRAAL